MKGAAQRGMVASIIATALAAAAHQAGAADVTDADRVFPGEGDFHLAPIVAKLRQIGYAGCVSLEVFNPVLWKAKPTQVTELGWTAVTRLLG